MVIVACCVLRSQQQKDRAKVTNSNTVDYNFEMKGGIGYNQVNPTPRLNQKGSLVSSGTALTLDEQATTTHMKQSGEENLKTAGSQASIFK